MERVIRVSLAAQVNGFVNGMNQAEQAARRAKAGSEDATAAYERQKQAMNEAGIALGTVGAVAMATTALAVKAAIDWESAWAGVTKTVDGSVTEMAQLQTELRGLATNLPATHQEIAAVAEAAGQLGVERQNVAAFTKTMVDLGETTNLTADQAATSLAQLMNVMRTAPEDVERLGATLVALGNDGASTEAEILEMAQRIAGAGKLIGASEGEVLGLANALASMGVTAELGGGVASRILQDLYSAVQSGGEQLQGFANVAGVTAQEFAAQFRADPVRALDTFAKGLNGVETSGGNVVATLADLGFRSSEEQRVLLQLKGAGDLLAESLDLQAVAWEQNTALAEEAEKRYATTEARLQVMANRVNEAAIEYGDVFLPAVQAAAEVVGQLALGFAQLPQPIQTTIAVTGALVGVVGLTGGAFLLAVPKIAEFRIALATLSNSTMPAVAGAANGITTAVGKTATGLSAAARFMTGPWGLALAAAGVAAVALQQQLEKLAATSEEMQNSLKLADGAAILDTARVSQFTVLDGVLTNSKQQLQDLDETLAQLEVSARGFTNGSWWEEGFWNPANKAALAGPEDALKRIGDELASLAATDGPGAASAFQRVAEQTDGSETSLRRLLTQMPAYEQALITQATAQGINVSAMTDAERVQALLNLATEEAAPAMQSSSDAYLLAAEQSKALTDSLNQLIDVTLEANGVAQDAETANARWQEALAGITADVERQKEVYEEANGTLDGFNLSLDRNTVAGSANRASLTDVARAAEEAATKQRDQDTATMGAEGSTRKYIDTLNSQRDAFIRTATEAGYNADEVHALADEIFRVPDSKTTQMLVETAQATDALRGFMTTLDRVPWVKNVRIQTTVAAAVSQDFVLPGRAGGGIIPGAPSNRDNRVYAVATGEYIVNARHTAIPENRAALEYMNAGGTMRLPGYAMGGFVNGAASPFAERPVYASSWGAAPAPAAARTETVPQVVIQKVIGTNEQQLAREIQRQQAHALAVSGVLRRDGD
ncbi:phage tail tape measure protein [Microbacterium thalli]|uniref:phage tail tape measure protein n=1 Tax=Microbacterium thalli TaxID=3027921 RepID=UPI002366678E|nr:phage tail tape measure protein [Microbacterium thalli]MDD7930066.1 phage tail tape measure protein [Microbacterium thalli]